MPDISTGNDLPFDIQGLYDMYGQETVAELLRMSVDESKGLLSQMIEGTVAHDSKIVMAAAHQLKGLASTMTITGLARLSYELETLCRQEDWDQVRETLTQLKTELERTASYVSELLS